MGRLGEFCVCQREFKFIELSGMSEACGFVGVLGNVPGCLSLLAEPVAAVRWGGDVPGLWGSWEERSGAACVSVRARAGWEAIRVRPADVNLKQFL